MSDYLAVAEQAAREAGVLLRENFESELHVDAMLAHDIKLELDVRSQELITKVLLGAFPDHAVLGEEGNSGTSGSEFEWIVDPIDGTVNYFFGIPHFCISIALRQGPETILGVVYDPMLNEMFATGPGSPPTRNGQPIRVSPRATLGEAVITIGFSKTDDALEAGFDRFKQVAKKVRKTRILGSAALGMAYIACGRLDAYLEESVSLWDIAAGELLIQRAGGRVTRIPHAGSTKFGVISSNGKLPLDHLV